MTSKIKTVGQVWTLWGRQYFDRYKGVLMLFSEIAHYLYNKEITILCFEAAQYYDSEAA